MSVTKVDHGGRPYRLVLVNGIESRIDLETTKYTIYEEFGLVNGGYATDANGHLLYSSTLPDGSVLDGYTDEPALVREYVELWDEASGVNSAGDDDDEPTP